MDGTSVNAELQYLAKLLRERNAVDARIADLIGRPVERGHLGEYIAAAVFDIELAKTATHKGAMASFVLVRTLAAAST